MRYAVTGQMASHTIESEAAFSDRHHAQMWFEMMADGDIHARIVLWDRDTNETIEVYSREDNDAARWPVPA